MMPLILIVQQLQPVGATVTSINFCTSSCAGCMPLTVAWHAVRRHVPSGLLCCQAWQQADTALQKLFARCLAVLARSRQREATVVVVCLTTCALCLEDLHCHNTGGSHLGSRSGLSPKQF